MWAYMLLNMLSKAVNAKPIANMDFIFTKDKSLLLCFNLSSSLSIFFFCCLSKVSPCVSLRFSTAKAQCSPYKCFFYRGLHFLLCFSTSVFSFWYRSVRYTISQVRPSPRKAVQIDMNTISRVSAHIFPIWGTCLLISTTI